MTADSSKNEIDIGVSQGSVLGTLLILIYVNDMDQCFGPEVELAPFADDASLIISGECNNSVELCGSININKSLLYITKPIT